jgi:hypothetical protein
VCGCVCVYVSVLCVWGGGGNSNFKRVNEQTEEVLARLA